MPTKAKATIGPAGGPEKYRADTMQTRLSRALLGDLFMAPDQSAVVVVIQQVDGAWVGLRIPTDGSPPEWTARDLEQCGIGADWTLHPVDHVHLKYGAEK